MDGEDADGGLVLSGVPAPRVCRGAGPEGRLLKDDANYCRALAGVLEVARRLGGNRATKVEAGVVLITERRSGGSNYFRQDSRRHKGDHNTNKCHHAAYASRQDTKPKPLMVRPGFPGVVWFSRQAG